MAHHKRRRPKNRRVGCLLCKPHKACGVKRSSNNKSRSILREKARMKEVEREG